MKGKKSLSIQKQDLLLRLHKLYPDARCALDHRSPFELLVSTVLSAQCTDERVNQVTPTLFQFYPNARAMSQAPLAHLQELVRSTGFFRSKALALYELSRSLVEKFGGEVPQTMEELTSLRGVGRKTANVVLGNAFSKNVGVVVDTHVGRLSRRFRWTKYTDPKKVELDLMKLVPQKDWTKISHELILHGRAYCKALRPKCEVCPLWDVCPSYQPKT